MVTYTGNGYNYYFLGVDETGQGVKNITSLENLDEDDIVSDIAQEEISNIVETTGIGGRKEIKVLNDDNKTWETVTNNATNNVAEGGSGGVTPLSNKICRRATSLHTATCSRTSGGCYGTGYYSGGSKDTTTITYGNTTTTNGKLTPGDAFDCDVNKDGTFDAATERFYYVTSSGDNAVLIYYTNVTGGTTTIQNTYAYDSSGQNWHGPVTAAAQLPSTTQWSNGGIIAPGTRQITTETGTTSTSGGTIESFTYTNKAARLLTTQELVAGCSSLSSVGNSTTGELDGCNYLMENVGRYTSTSGTYGYWLESPRESSSSGGWYVLGFDRRVYNGSVLSKTSNGVRPAITVLKSNISY